MVARFSERFREVERLARAGGRPLDQMTLAEMDALWEQAKASVRSPEPPFSGPAHSNRARGSAEET